MNALLLLLEHFKTFPEKKNKKNHHELYKSLIYVKLLQKTKSIFEAKVIYNFRAICTFVIAERKLPSFKHYSICIFIDLTKNTTAN